MAAFDGADNTLSYNFDGANNLLTTEFSSAENLLLFDLDGAKDLLLCVYNVSVAGTDGLLGIEDLYVVDSDSVLRSPNRSLGVNARDHLLKKLLDTTEASSTMFTTHQKGCACSTDILVEVVNVCGDIVTVEEAS